MINKTFYTKNNNFDIEDVNELGFAVKQGNYIKTLSILKNKIDVNRFPSKIEVYNSVEKSWTKQDNKHNKTILILALECRLDKIKNREKIVTLLIEHGADISISDTQNDTPLHYATRNSMSWRKSHLPFRIPSGKAHLSFLENNFYHYYWDSIDNCVEILLKAGADPNMKNKHGNTPLHYGCSQGMLPPDIKKLIEHGANIHAKNNLGATPLHVCFSRWDGQRYSMHDSMHDMINSIPLYECAHINFWKSAATTLIAFGANINEQDNDGYTPLFHWLCTYSPFCKASSAGHSFTKRGIRFFGENKADINISNNRQVTPLHYVCWACHTDAVKMLVKAGANVNALTLNNKTPLDLALDDSYPWSPHRVYDFYEKTPAEKRRVEKILKKAGAKRNDELRQEKSVLANKQPEQKYSFSVAVLNILIIVVIVGTILKSCYS